MARILLVEDDKLIVEALSELLASEGYEVDDSPPRTAPSRSRARRTPATRSRSST